MWKWVSTGPVVGTLPKARSLRAAARDKAYARIQAAQWNQSTALENTCQTALAQAQSQFNSAQFAAASGVLTALAQTVDLPWADFQAQLAAADAVFANASTAAELAEALADANQALADAQAERAELVAQAQAGENDVTWPNLPQVGDLSAYRGPQAAAVDYEGYTVGLPGMLTGSWAGYDEIALGEAVRGVDWVENATQWHYLTDFEVFVLASDGFSYSLGDYWGYGLSGQYVSDQCIEPWFNGTYPVPIDGGPIDDGLFRSEAGAADLFQFAGAELPWPDATSLAASAPLFGVSGTATATDEDDSSYLPPVSVPTSSSDSFEIQPVCFAAGTPIVLADGASRAIDQIQPGDVVLAVSDRQPDGAVEAKRVLEVYHNPPKRIVSLHVAGQEIRVTLEHPFYVRGKGWVAASKLQPGDELRTPADRFVAVTSVEDRGDSVPVFNLHVAEHHTYFVGGGEWQFSILAHNSSGEEGTAVPVSFLGQSSVPELIARINRQKRELDEYFAAGQNHGPSPAAYESYADWCVAYQAWRTAQPRNSSAPYVFEISKLVSDHYFPRAPVAGPSITTGATGWRDSLNPAYQTYCRSLVDYYLDHPNDLDAREFFDRAYPSAGGVWSVWIPTPPREHQHQVWQGFMLTGGLAGPIAGMMDARLNLTEGNYKGALYDVLYLGLQVPGMMKGLRQVPSTIARSLTEADLGITAKLARLEGTITTTGRTTVVRIDVIKGAVPNPLGVVENLIRVARAQGSTTLRIEGTLVLNPRLIHIMQVRYGAVMEAGRWVITLPL